MAKISLRMYNREIEGLVEQGQRLDEAIAHCRHILQTFPKHLETYRLLGKAYLEAKRYDQAVDIFQRVLVAAPEDFVSHVGMSIIADDKGRLDDALWHMERAFEVQPSNAAIQAELQRLFGRRDGVQPPKIRLTRGALAHMYVQGELFNQAISEIRAVLSGDPKRTDMQTLLAHAYFKNGQKAEAADACNQLLGKYPYCLEANRIMAELAPSPSQPEAGQEYRQRVLELDPYAAYSTDLFHSDNVGDGQVTLERLEYTGETAEMPPTLGIGLETDAAVRSGLTEAASVPPLAEQPQSDLPAWLQAARDGAPAAPAAPSTPDPNDLPAFLRDAGWRSSSAEAGPFEEPASDAAADAAVEGDLPAWVRAMAPAPETAPEPQPPAEGDIFAATAGGLEQSLAADTPDWLNGLGDSAAPPLAEPRLEEPGPEAALPAEVPDWLRDMGPAPSETVASASTDMPAAAAAPELTGLEEPRPEAAVPADVPDWLRDMGPADSAESVEATAAEPEQTRLEEPGSQAAVPADVPEWLRFMEPADSAETADVPAAEVEETPEWLKGLDGRELDEAPIKHDGVTDWLSNLEAEQPPAAPATPIEESPAWLKDFGNDLETPIAKAPEPPAPEPAIIEPELQAPAAPVEESPAWLKEISTDLETPSAKTPESLAPEPAIMEPEPAASVPPASEVPAALGGLGTSTKEQDDAMAWLEALASKHGAKPEELVTDPSLRSEIAPEWVDRATQIGEQAAAAPEAAGPVPPEGGMVEPASDAVKTEPVKTEPAAPEVPATLGGLGTSAQEQDDAMSWLEALAAKHGARPEELVTDPSTRSEAAPEWVDQARQIGEQAAAAPEAAEPAQMEAAQAEPPAAQPDMDETGIWLRSLTEQTSPVHEAEAPAGQPREEPQEEPLDLRSSFADQTGFVTDEAEARQEEAPLVPEDLTPDWLRDIEQTPAAAGLEDAPSWLRGLQEQEPAPAQAEPAEEPAPAAAEEAPSELPAWLADLEKEEAAAAAPASERPTTDELPSWLQSEAEPEPEAKEPANPADWRPIAVPEPASKFAPIIEQKPEPVTPEPPVHEAPPAEAEVKPELVEQAPEPVRMPEPVPTRLEEPRPAPAPVAPRVETRREPAKARPAAAAQPKPAAAALADAQLQLGRGNIAAALDVYGKLIRKGKSLEDIIRDLRDALYRYPVEVPLWQSLGDAYMRANRLQEALDAYTKAEELLR